MTRAQRFHADMAKEAQERLRRHEVQHGLPPGSLRTATSADMAPLYRELEARYFPAALGCLQLHHQPCWNCQRLTGAAGDP